jgi:hypothetical protein
MGDDALYEQERDSRINEDKEVSLRDGATLAFTGCKAGGAKG